MRSIAVILATTLFLVVSGVSFEAHAAEKAKCVVCVVKEGASEAEPVKAVRTHENVRYAFCSEKCAKQFDADPAAFVPPIFPRPAPELALVDLAGTSLDWKTLQNRVVLVDFWATWCAPCRKSMPELQALHNKYKDRGFTVIGVSIDEDGPAKVRKFVTSKKISYPIAIDSEKAPAWDRFRVKAVPAAFLVDREGRVVAQWTGVAADAKELEAKVVALLGKADEAD